MTRILDDKSVIGVIGAGTMGNGIAHVFAKGGFQVLLCDVQQAFLDRGLAAISTNLEREVTRGKFDRRGTHSCSWPSTRRFGSRRFERVPLCD